MKAYIENHVRLRLLLMSRKFYEARAKSIIKELREQKNLSYKELARRLDGQGWPMTDQVLINRINRGTFSFAFAMQLLAVMGEEQLALPKPPRSTTGERS